MTNGKPALRRKTVDCGSASINAVDDSPGCGRRIELATVDFLNSLVKPPTHLPDRIAKIRKTPRIFWVLPHPQGSRNVPCPQHAHLSTVKIVPLVA